MMSTRKSHHTPRPQRQQIQSESREPLLVQIKIKNKSPRNILIGNMHDMGVIDQQIKWFITTNRLKEEAFDYIKPIIIDQIKGKEIKSSLSYSLVSVNEMKAEKGERKKQLGNKNFTLRECENSAGPRKSSGKAGIKQPHHIQIKINNIGENNDTEDPRQYEQSFAFNSSFTLPSSIGSKAASFYTDPVFENAFDTTGKNSSDFSTVNEMNKNQTIKVNYLNLSLSGRDQKIKLKNQTSKILNQAQKESEDSNNISKQSQKKPPIKITLTKKNRENIHFERKSISSGKKLISTKARKDAIITPKRIDKAKIYKDQFLIYDAENLENMVEEHLKKSSNKVNGTETQQNCQQNQIPDYLQSQLKVLFSKLTQNNPHEIGELHSQYVSYQQLTREELLFMGALFQKINHQQLSHLNYTHFKHSSIKYCRKELDEMHAMKARTEKIKIGWEYARLSHH